MIYFGVLKKPQGREDTWNPFENGKFRRFLKSNLNDAQQLSLPNTDIKGYISPTAYDCKKRFATITAEKYRYLDFDSRMTKVEATNFLFSSDVYIEWQAEISVRILQRDGSS